MTGAGLGDGVIENAVAEHPPLPGQPSEPSRQLRVEAIAAQLVDGDQDHEFRRLGPTHRSQKTRDEKEKENTEPHERRA